MRWEDDSLHPVGHRWRVAAGRQLVVGEQYQITEAATRSAKSHNHFFACVHHAWQSLPETMAELPHAKSSEHLRKFALIHTGFHNVEYHTCANPAEAERWASRIRPLDEFSIVHVDGNNVVRMTPQSQSMTAMGAAKFQESKQKVLEYLADLICVSVDDLANVAGEAA